MGVCALSSEGTDNPGVAIPVYQDGRLVGYWHGPLPAWGFKLAYRMARGANPDGARQIDMKTRFDEKWNAVGLEIEDADLIAGWPEFRRVR